MAKDAENRRKHGYSLHDGIACVANVASKMEVQNVDGEERILYVGPAADGKVLVVVVEWLDTDTQEPPAIRFISVRLLAAGIAFG